MRGRKQAPQTATTRECLGCLGCLDSPCVLVLSVVAVRLIGMSQFRLQPTPAQEQALLEHCGHARFVWNLAVEQHAHWS
ncbi:helix-turn-helix domain-containing protein, partial [Actinokineospora sp.]|uniref:helix-turn-helix domain-containing protein n=1 Tax=Actinokineospora sp. TaxID=1872133 RepID=UPI003D6B2E40